MVRINWLRSLPIFCQSIKVGQFTESDNNQRAIFFGSQGDTRSQQKPLETQIKDFVHHQIDVGDRSGILNLIDIRPDAIAHTETQPTHDVAAAIPFDDFDIHAVGTLNLYKRIINLV
ncbi:hypothetical protein OGM63_28385 [Plectonema radiosum NIES-515]|uniref:Uncharacterized protein n=1 Tax=Plectonema radiosum NIES-515 TaxID=2986073 RepID=A0ABT3B8U4_9CYAN|nr:hypothetical protein [Plectonema radiosum]MCV3217380.1 hypothetical protein [Plectonema radiosum NIES-515]